MGGAALLWMLHHGGFERAKLTQSLALLVFKVRTFFIKFERTDYLLPRFNPSQRPVAVGQPKAEANPPLGCLFAELWRGLVEKYSLRAFGIILLGYLGSYLFGNAYFHLIHSLHWPDAEGVYVQGSWGSLVSFAVLLGGA